MPFELPPRDPRLHVFAAAEGHEIDHTTYLDRLRGEGVSDGVAEALSAPVDASKVEAFDAADVSEMGLRAYLAQAYDADPAALEAEAAWLDALRGTVVVLAPGALPAGGTVTPEPELRLVGSYPTAQPDHVAAPLPEAEVAPRIATPAESTGTPMQKKTIVWIVLAVLAVILLLVAL